jgi:hypothetical protein
MQLAGNIEERHAGHETEEPFTVHPQRIALDEALDHKWRV